MSLSRNWIGRFLIFITLTIPAACAPNKQMAVGSAATLLEEVAKSSYKQSDLRVIREGMPGNDQRIKFTHYCDVGTGFSCIQGCGNTG